MPATSRDPRHSDRPFDETEEPAPTLSPRLLPVKQGYSMSPLDSAGGHANDDLPLDEGGQNQHRQSDDERRRGKRSPRQLFERQDVEDRDRQGPRLPAGQDNGEDEVVPGEDKGQDGSNDHAWSGQGEGDVAESRPDTGAVDESRLFELGVQVLEKPHHHPDSDR